MELKPVKAAVHWLRVGTSIVEFNTGGYQYALITSGVNLYTFGVALAPPPNAEFGPLNGALGPRNHWMMSEYRMVRINPLD